MQRRTNWGNLIAYGILGGIFLGLFIDKCSQPLIFVREAEAATSTEAIVQPVMIEVHYSEEGIERLIRQTFVGEEDLSVAIVKSEGGLVKEIQSHFVKNGVREPSFCAFQLHEPSWMKKAKELGYGDYKTNVESCVKMAKYIRDHYGWVQWSGYNNESYKAYLK